jgi:V8-like Glu-specific endopeptidase
MWKLLGLILALVFVPGIQARAAASSDGSCAGGACLPVAEFLYTQARPTLLHQANVFSDDPEVLKDPRRPQPQNGDGKIYAPIGLITPDNPVPVNIRGTNTSKTQATAFLVSPCFIMTNYHAIFGSQITAVADLDMERYRATFKVSGRETHAVVVVAGERQRGRDHDYAFLKLDTCLGADSAIGWLRLGPLPPDGSGPKVSLAGYPGDKDSNILWIHENCHLDTRRNSSFLRFTNCANSRGASGSPIVSHEDGAIEVVGIISAEVNRTDRILPTYDERRANVAVDVFWMLRENPVIARTIAADILKHYKADIQENDRMMLNLCLGENLGYSEIEGCTAAINWLSSKAMIATARDRVLGDDELRQMWISTKH